MKKKRIIELLDHENTELALHLRITMQQKNRYRLALHEARVKIAELNRQIEARDEVGPF